MGKSGRAYASGKMGSSRILIVKDIGLIVGVSFGITAGIAWLFYDSPVGMLSGILVIPMVVILVQKEKQKKRHMKIQQEFKEYMYSVGNSMQTGYAPERAFLNAQIELKKLYGESSIVVNLLEGMEKRLNVKEPLENILRDFAADSNCEDIESFVEVFCYAKRSGGDFLHIIQTTINRICDKAEISKEIQMVMAEKALEEKVMCVIPMGILLFFRVTSPEFISVLYGNVLGVCVMTVALILYGAAFFLAQKIVKIEV